MANGQTTDWTQKLNDAQTRASIAPGDAGYAEANAEMVGRTLRGFGPDSAQQDPRAGSHVVFNMQAAPYKALLPKSEGEDTSADEGDTACSGK